MAIPFVPNAAAATSGTFLQPAVEEVLPGMGSGLCLGQGCAPCIQKMDYLGRCLYVLFETVHPLMLSTFYTDVQQTLTYESAGVKV